MSIVGANGAQIDVARRPKRDLDDPAATFRAMMRLVKYDQCVRLAMAGYKPSKIAPAVGYTKQHVCRILREMRVMRSELDAG